ncbi:putative reverse transcriptase domain-containing protein [Tanacetum coccineum]
MRLIKIQQQYYQLLDGSEDVVVYCDASNQGLESVLNSDYSVEIQYHPGKANVVADALSRKERVKPKRVRAMAMTIHSGVKGIILAAQSEAFDQENNGSGKITPPWNSHHKTPRTRNGHDEIWVVVDRLTKSAHFLAIRKDYSTEKLARLYTDKIVVRHGVPVSIISDRDARFTSHDDTIQNVRETCKGCVLIDIWAGSWDVHLLLAEFSCNNSYHTSIRCAPFEALYGRKCRSPVLWAEIGEGSLIGPELVHETR